MNILFYFENQINPVRGGTERVAWLISKYLKSKGHNISYLCKHIVYDINSEISDVIPETLNKNGKIDFINKYVSDNNIDIIVNEGGNTDDIYLFSHTNIPDNVKIISCLHFDVSGDLKYFYSSFKYSLNNCNISSIIKYLYRYIKLPFLKIYHTSKRKQRYAHMVKYSDKVVLLSEKSLDSYIKFIHNKSIKYKLISIINPNTFNTDDINITNKENTIIYVGRLEYSPKRVDRVLKVWKLLQDKFPSWDLKIIGGGAYLENYKRLSNKLKLKRVEWAGFTDSEPYYSKAKILLLTSNFEGTPMVIPEAMAYGVIPIVMNSFTNADLHIRNGENGFLTKPFSCKEMAKQCEVLMNNQDLYNTMSRNAQIAVKNYNINKIGPKWERLINTI